MLIIHDTLNYLRGKEEFQEFLLFSYVVGKIVSQRVRSRIHSVYENLHIYLYILKLYNV